MRINKTNWRSFATTVSAPALPEEYNEAAVDRLMSRIEQHVVRVKGVRAQFEPVNTVRHIHFESEEERNYYNETWERYLKEKADLEAAIEAGTEQNGGLMQLVLLMKQCEAAEYCRRYHIVRNMMKKVSEGKAAVCAAKFKKTINSCVEIMIQEYGISRDNISLIYGGGQTDLTAKMKAKKAIQDKTEQLKAIGMDEDEIMEMLDLKKVQVREIKQYPKEWRLGAQSLEERQKEIDKFQKGQTLFCFYSFKAGGVGLSLHHTDELLNVKVRRKASGYAVEDDIAKIPTRPRYVIVAPTYSAIELVQGLGRCPRLNSLSPTEQEIVFYAGTVEESVAAVVSQKLRCLSRVVRMKESWQDIVKGSRPEDFMQQTELAISDDEQAENEDTLLGGGGGEDEE